MAELRIFSRLDVEAELERLRSCGLNFDPAALPRLRREPGWHVDHYRAQLPAEAPGEPVERGPWAVARELCAAYEFVDPGHVHAFYDPKDPFEGRTMLLEVYYWGLRVYAGVRIGGSFDGHRVESGHRARVWAWNYRTLSGHFEQGEIDYEVWKWLESGRVEFRIDAVSRQADAKQPVVNFGFRIVGRSRQIQFARTACDRMAQLTRERFDGVIVPAQ